MIKIPSLPLTDTVYFPAGSAPPAFTDSMVKTSPVAPWPMVVAMKESEFADIGQIYGFEMANAAITGFILQVFPFNFLNGLFCKLLQKK